MVTVTPCMYVRVLSSAFPVAHTYRQIVPDTGRVVSAPRPDAAGPVYERVGMT